MWYGPFGDTLWFLRGQYGSFGNTLTAVWGGPLLYTEGIFWGSRPPYSSWYVICSPSGSVCDSRSCQAIQYTQGSQSYDYLFSVMYTLHLYALLTEFYTHKYSYIVEGTDAMWVRGGAPTFWPRLVYMSILTLWFSDRGFCAYSECVYIIYILWKAHFARIYICMHRSM